LNSYDSVFEICEEKMAKTIDLFVKEKYTLLKILLNEYNIYNTTSLSKSYEDAIPAIKTPYVIIDFTEVTYIDSSGIGSLAHVKKNLNKNGIEMLCAGMIENVIKVFRITNTESLFQIFDTVDDSVKFINANL
jgi:anti-anti-sigma factor